VGQVIGSEGKQGGEVVVKGSSVGCRWAGKLKTVEGS
jgi:hypothetical protein